MPRRPTGYAQKMLPVLISTTYRDSAESPGPENSLDIIPAVSALLYVRRGILYYIRKSLAFWVRWTCAVSAITLTSCNCITRPSTEELRSIALNSELNARAFARATRPAYPYSVILGGAYSVPDLQNAIARDPAIASHYAGFDIAHTVLLRNDRAMLRYVSYRKDDHIVWTRVPLRIPQGELLLSDGVSLARARCGNRLSATPVRPAPERAPDVELSIPDIEPPHANAPLKRLDGSEPGPPLSDLLMEPDEQSAFANPNLLLPSTTARPMVTGMAGTSPGTLFPVAAAGPSNLITPVPEPSTQGQVALTLGLVLIVALSFRRSNRNTK